MVKAFKGRIIWYLCLLSDILRDLRTKVRFLLQRRPPMLLEDRYAKRLLRRRKVYKQLVFFFWQVMNFMQTQEWGLMILDGECSTFLVPKTSIH